MRRAQLWSTDVILGVTIFIGVIALFYVSLSMSSKSDYPIIKDEAKIATNRLLEPDSSINILDEQNEVNMTRLEELADMDYGGLRDQLGLRGDYCIYLEDRFGRIIPVKNQSGIGKTLNVSGTVCGENMVPPS